MTRFHFHVRGGSVYRFDRLGVELNDIEGARTHAERVLQELRERYLELGETAPDLVVDIADPAGVIFETVDRPIAR